MRLPWQRRAARRRHVITVLSKPGCLLCDKAVELLRGLQFERTLAVEVEDIQQDPQRFDQYRERIPVLIIDGRVELDPPHDAARIRSVLDRLDQEADDAS